MYANIMSFYLRTWLSVDFGIHRMSWNRYPEIPRDDSSLWQYIIVPDWRHLTLKEFSCFILSDSLEITISNPKTSPFTFHFCIIAQNEASGKILRNLLLLDSQKFAGSYKSTLEETKLIKLSTYFEWMWSFLTWEKID